MDSPIEPSTSDRQQAPVPEGASSRVADAAATTPAVSVVLPAYNAGQHLLAAVRSVLDDGFRDLELRIVDDGSTDGSIDELIAAVHDDRLVVVRQENRGLAAALNRGFAEARGRFIARMDGDDLVVPGRFEVQTRFLEQHLDVVLVGGQVDRMVDGTARSTTTFPLNHRDIVTGLLAGRHVLCHPAVMIRASAMSPTDVYWQHGVAEDWDLFLRLSERGGLANVDHRVLQYRFHDGGINAGSMASVRHNIRLAVANHHRRVKGRPELGPDQLLRAIGPMGRLGLAAQTRSLMLYRSALRADADGRVLGARAAMVAAAALWPRQALHRLRERR